jgi:hypothetical protein
MTDRHVPQPTHSPASLPSPKNDPSVTLDVEPRKPCLAWQGMERKEMPGGHAIAGRPSQPQPLSTASGTCDPSPHQGTRGRSSSPASAPALPEPPLTDVYPIGSRDYLARARAELASGRSERLFYAAFELRAGIEQRLQEYLEANESMRRSKKHGWKVGVLGAELERMFRNGDKVAEIILSNADGTYLGRLLHTPVTRSLRQQAKKLGEQLHAAKQFRPADDPWWSRFRASLEQTVVLLSEATTGTLMAPPLFQRSTGMANWMIEIVGPEDRFLADRIGQHVVMRVAYHDSVPLPAPPA